MAKKKRQKLYFEREPEKSLPGKLKKLSRKKIEETFGDWCDLFKRPKGKDPWLHQMVCVMLGIDQPRWLFALDTGTGKTAIAIWLFAFRQKLGDATKCIVSVPPVAVRKWGREIEMYSDFTYTLIEGTPGQKLDALLNADTDFVVVSNAWLIKILSQALYIIDGDKEANLDVDEFDEALARFDMVVLDEAHGLKNHESRGFQGVSTFLMDSPNFYELTGTPTGGNNYTDAWGLYYLIDRGETYEPNFGDFVNEYFNVFLIKNKYPKYSIRKDKKEEFFNKFWNKAIRYEEQECLDLPKANWSMMPLGMTKKQNKLYDRLLVRDDVDHYDFMRVTGGVHKECYGESMKLNALEELCDEIVVQAGDCLIVWHWLNDEGVLISEFLRKRMKLRVGESRGKISPVKKRRDLELWHRREIDVMVANPGSLGEAEDLYEARFAIYYSNGRAYLKRHQSEGRIRRGGQTRKQLFIDLVCEGTVDEIIYDALNEAQDAFVGLTRDKRIKAIQNFKRGEKVT